MLAIAKIYTKGAAAEGKHYNRDQHAVRIILNDRRVYDIKLVDTGAREYPLPLRHNILWIHGLEGDPAQHSLDASEQSGLVVGANGYAPGVGLLLNMRQNAAPEITSAQAASMYVNSGDTSDPAGMTWILGEVVDGKAVTGIGVSNDGSTIILRSRGGEIVLGEDGALIGGNKIALAAEQQQSSSFMAKNPLHTFLPPAFFIPVPENLPDISAIQKFAQLGTAMMRLLSI